MSAWSLTLLTCVRVDLVYTDTVTTYSLTMLTQIPHSHWPRRHHLCVVVDYADTVTTLTHIFVNIFAKATNFAKPFFPLAAVGLLYPPLAAVVLLYPPLVAVNLLYPPLAAVVLLYPPLAAVLLLYPPLAAVLYPPLVAVVLLYPPLAAVFLLYPSLAAVVLLYPPLAAVVLLYPPLAVVFFTLYSPGSCFSTLSCSGSRCSWLKYFSKILEIGENVPSFLSIPHNPSITNLQLFISISGK